MTQYIDYLLNTILPLTGLTSDGITALTGELNSSTAIIYGSSILYSAKKDTNRTIDGKIVMGPGDVPINDVDILVSSVDVLNTLALIIYTNLKPDAIPDIYDANNYITSPDIRTNPNYKHGSNDYVNINLISGSNIGCVLNHTIPPTGSSQMGTLVVDPYISTNQSPQKDISQTPLIGYKSVSFLSSNYISIQLVLIQISPIPPSLVDYISAYGDFTVASGSYDGTNIVIPLDIASNFTIYREIIDINNIHKDWMLYRLDKYIKRGFTVFFDNQTQIDKWDGILYNSFFPAWGATSESITLSPFILYVAPTCFAKDAQILCLIDNKEVYILIQNIKKNDLIKTTNGDYIPVYGTKCIEFYDSVIAKDRLYKLSMDNYPELTEDLYVTGMHAILVDNITEFEKEKILELYGKIFITGDKYRLPACINNEPEIVDDKINIYHIALNNKNIYSNFGIYANGLLVETCSINKII